MLRLSKLRSSAANAAVGFNQLPRIKRLTTGFTLVTSGTSGMAVRTGALYIAVREKTLAKGLPTLPENFQDDLPALGWASREKVMVDGEKRARVHTCYLAEAWKELGGPEIGRLYCFVDQAKYEAYDPDLECVHTKNVLDGDPYCELAVRSKKKKK